MSQGRSRGGGARASNQPSKDKKKQQQPWPARQCSVAARPKPSRGVTPSGLQNNTEANEYEENESSRLQQAVLDVFRHSFADALTEPRLSSTLPQTLQEIKAHLYARDFAAAFGQHRYLEAYAVRWSAGRALGYAYLLDRFLRKQLPHIRAEAAPEPVQRRKKTTAWKFICLGGGAGAELVALAALPRLFSSSSSSSSSPLSSPPRCNASEDRCTREQVRIETVLIDAAAWYEPVLAPLHEALTTPSPPPPTQHHCAASSTATSKTYAKQTEQQQDSSFIESAQLKVSFHQQDLLSCSSSSDAGDSSERTEMDNLITAALQHAVADDDDDDDDDDEDMKITTAAAGHGEHKHKEDENDDEEEQKEKGEALFKAAAPPPPPPPPPTTSNTNSNNNNVAPVVVTLMFTLNELYGASLRQTQALLLRITAAAPPGTLLLVVDSPGSYSTVSLNGRQKSYPMQWLLDYTLLRCSSPSPSSASTSTATSTSTSASESLSASLCSSASSPEKSSSESASSPASTTTTSNSNSNSNSGNNSYRNNHSHNNSSNSSSSSGWTRLETHDSLWFRLPGTTTTATTTNTSSLSAATSTTSTTPTNTATTTTTKKARQTRRLAYPLNLENMRVQLHLYRRV